MLCSKCGTENKEQAEVCINCGETLTQSSETGESNTNDSADFKQVTEQKTETRETIKWDTDKPKPRITNLDFKSNNSGDKPVVSPGLNVFVLLSSVFLPIIGIAMGFAYLRKQHPDAKKAGKTWLIVGVSLFLIHGLMIMTNAN